MGGMTEYGPPPVCKIQEKSSTGPHRFKKGQSGNPKGKPKGTPNKITLDAKTHILQVFEALQEDPKTSLKTLAKSDRKWFYESIWRHIIPRELKADVNHDIVGNLMELAVQVHRDLSKSSPAGATSSPASSPGPGPDGQPGPTSQEVKDA